MTIAPHPVAQPAQNRLDPAERELRVRGNGRRRERQRARRVGRQVDRPAGAALAQRCGARPARRLEHLLHADDRPDQQRNLHERHAKDDQRHAELPDADAAGRDEARARRRRSHRGASARAAAAARAGATSRCIWCRCSHDAGIAPRTSTAVAPSAPPGRRLWRGRRRRARRAIRGAVWRWRCGGVVRGLRRGWHGAQPLSTFYSVVARRSRPLWVHRPHTSREP